MSTNGYDQPMTKNKNVTYSVNKYIVKKYGISLESIYKKMNGMGVDYMSTDAIYSELKNKYGVGNLDWLYLYNNMNQFISNDDEILEYIGGRILKNDGIYDYFVKNKNLRIVGTDKKTRSKGMVDSYMSLRWEGGVCEYEWL